MNDEHDARSLQIFNGLKSAAGEYWYQYEFLESGGDGDEGERLLDLLDTYFTKEDNNATAMKSYTGAPPKIMSND